MDPSNQHYESQDEAEEIDFFDALAPPRLVARLLMLFFGFQLFLALLDSALGSVYAASLIAASVFLIGLPALMIIQSGYAILPTLRLQPISRSQLGWIACLTFAILFPIELLSQLNVLITPIPPETIEFLDSLRPDSLLSWAFAGLAICVVAPLGEEVVFRGLLQQSMRIVVGPIWGAVAVGLIFALIHFAPWSLLGLAPLGILMGLVFERSGNLTASFALHAAYNAIVLFLLGNDSAAEFSLPMPVMLVLAVGGCLLGWLAYSKIEAE